MLNVAIRDDEKNIRTYLSSLMKKQGTECEITEYASADEYVFDAFDVGAFQYLLKPIDEQKFAEVFKRAVGQIAADREQQREVSNQKTLIVSYANDKRAIPLTDIYYMESQGHKIVLYMKNEKLEYYVKIGELEKELQGQFYRIHKGYLFNLSHVEGYNKTEVTMANGDKLLISKYKYDVLSTFAMKLFLYRISPLQWAKCPWHLFSSTEERRLLLVKSNV